MNNMNADMGSTNNIRHPSCKHGTNSNSNNRKSNNNILIAEQ